MLSKYLYDSGETIYRVLAEHDAEVLVIDCLKRTMPQWIDSNGLSDDMIIDDSELFSKTRINPVSEEKLSRAALATAHKIKDTL